MVAGVAEEAVAEDEGSAEFVSLLITSTGIASGELAHRGIPSIHGGPGAAPMVWFTAAAAAECSLLLAA